MKKMLSLIIALVIVMSMLALPACAQEQVTLSFLSWQNETTLEPIIQAFEAAYPYITVDLQYAPPVNDYLEKFRVLVAGGELPDVFVTAAENNLEVQEQGLAADLSDLPEVAHLASANKNTYTDAQGKLIAFAPTAWIAGVFYNKGMLDECGIAVPTNHAEYVASMAALAAAGKQPWVFSSGNLYDPLQGYVATETIAKDPDYDRKANAGDVTYTDGWMTPLQDWKKYYLDPGYVPEEALGLDGDQCMSAFINGEACYTIGATWSVANIDESNPDLDYGMLPWFGVDSDEKWCTGAAGVGWSINANAKEPEAARLFLEFITDPAQLAVFQAQTGDLLCVDNVEYEIHPVIKMCAEELQSGRFYLPAVAWKYSGALGQLLTTGTQEVLMGTKTIEDLAASFDAKYAELEAAQ